MSHYTHFTTQEREITMVSLAKGESLRTIAKKLNRNPSTLSRETRSNTAKNDEYNAAKAGVAYRKRRAACCPKCKCSSSELADYIKECLQQKWSPEQISGSAGLDGNFKVSHSTIYRALDRKLLPVSLQKSLRIKGKYRVKKGDPRGTIRDCLSIHERPIAAKIRSEAGHWESDTVHGKHNTGDFATHVERKTGLLIACKLENLKNRSFNHATAKAFEPLDARFKKSFTVDRGPEFMAHKHLHELTGMPVYFCDAGCPGQRGLNENTNGLLRQFFPKGQSFKNVTQATLDEAVVLINNRPRKRLGWRSPLEVVDAVLRLD